MAQEWQQYVNLALTGLLGGALGAVLTYRSTLRGQDKIDGASAQDRDQKFAILYAEEVKQNRENIKTLLEQGKQHLETQKQNNEQFRALGTEIDNLKSIVQKSVTELADCQTDRANLHIEVDKLKETIVRYERMGKASHHVADWNTEPMT